MLISETTPASSAIEEPYITNMTFFTYTRIQEKKDSLVILFGKDSVVKITVLKERFLS